MHINQQQMSRNEEKARAALNRWRQFSTSANAHGEGGNQKRRKLASDCNSLVECEQTRRELVEQITAKIEEIQRAVPDEKCKQLNDSINKLLRVKAAWERQIRAFGGPDYRQDKDKKQGQEYVYFGAAKELPEVKALFKRKEASAIASKLGESVSVPDRSTLSFDYFGLDDDDLKAAEIEAEALARKAACEEFAASNPSSNARDEDPHWSEYWKIPSKEDVDAALLDFRKEQLLKRYVA